MTSEHIDGADGRSWEIVRCDEHKAWWQGTDDDPFPDCPDPCDKCVYLEKSP